jgi:hypothetical protein
LGRRAFLHIANVIVRLACRDAMLSHTRVAMLAMRVREARDAFAVNTSLSGKMFF